MRKKILFFGLTGVLVSGAAIGGTVAATYIWKKQTTKTGVFSWEPAVLDAASKAEIGSKDYDAQINKNGRYFEYKSRGINYVFSSFEKLATFLNYQSFTSGFNVSTPTGSEFYGGFDSLKSIGITKNNAASLTKDFAPFTGDVSDKTAQDRADNVGSKIKIGGVTYYVVNKTKELTLDKPAWFNDKDTVQDKTSTPSQSLPIFDTSKTYSYKTTSESVLYSDEKELLNDSISVTSQGYPTEKFGTVKLDSPTPNAGEYKFFPASALDNPAYSSGFNPVSYNLLESPKSKDVVTVDGVTYAFFNSDDFDDYKEGISFYPINVSLMNYPHWGWLENSSVGDKQDIADSPLGHGGVFGILSDTNRNDTFFYQIWGEYADPRENTDSTKGPTRWPAGTTPPGYSFMLNGKPFHYYDAQKGGGREWWFGKGEIGKTNAAVQSNLWYDHTGDLKATSKNQKTLKPIIGYNDALTWNFAEDPSDAQVAGTWSAQYPMYSFISTDPNAFHLVTHPGAPDTYYVEKVDPNDKYNEIYFIGTNPSGWGARGYDTPTEANSSLYHNRGQFSSKFSNLPLFLTSYPSQVALLTKDNISTDWKQKDKKQIFEEVNGANGTTHPQFNISKIKSDIKMVGLASVQQTTPATKTSGAKGVPLWDKLNEPVIDQKLLSQDGSANGGGVWTLVTDAANMEFAGWQVSAVATHPAGWYRVDNNSKPVLADGKPEGTGGVKYQPLEDKDKAKFSQVYKIQTKTNEYVTDAHDPSTGYQAPSPAIAGWYKKTATGFENKLLAFGAWGSAPLYSVMDPATKILTYYSEVDTVKTLLHIQSTNNGWKPDKTKIYEIHDKNTTGNNVVNSFKFINTVQPITFNPLPGTTEVPSYLVTEKWDGTETGLTMPGISHDDQWFKDLFLYDADMVSGTSDDEYFVDEKSLYAAAKVTPIILAPGAKLYTDSHNEIIDATADENTLVNYGIGIYRQKDLKLTNLSGSDVVFIDNVEYHPVFE